MNDQELTHISLFSGIGGFDIAGEWAGFRTVVFCENEPFCQSVLKKHWPEVPLIPDIRDFDGTKWQGATILTGGPPCQRTSVAAAIQGKRTGETLWPEMARVIKEAFPSWIIIEQPSGNKKWENQVAISLEKIGYRFARFERQASDCGAPHQRRRVFIIANASSQRLYSFARLRKTSALEKESWPSPPRGTWRAARTGNSGVDDGISDWVDRLKALGNSIVPQIAFEIMKRIAWIERHGN